MLTFEASRAAAAVSPQTIKLRGSRTLKEGFSFCSVSSQIQRSLSPAAIPGCGGGGRGGGRWRLGGAGGGFVASVLMCTRTCGCSWKARSPCGLPPRPATTRCCRSCRGTPGSAAAGWRRCSARWHSGRRRSRGRSKSRGEGGGGKKRGKKRRAC